MANQKDEIKFIFHIEQDGNIVPHPMVRGTAVPEIPPGVFSLVYEEPTPMTSAKIYLRPENSFKTPQRVYGGDKINDLVTRFIKSYELDDKNLGIVLMGERGSGKTMLLKTLSAKVIEMGFPVILVDEKIPAGVLNWFLSTITQQCLVNFDEFEKVYDDVDDQTGILRLLDGTNTGAKKMYCFTINDKDNVSKYMFGRPSRVRYVLPFKRLEVNVIAEYVQANLSNCTEDHLRAFLHTGLCDGRESNGMNFDSMVEYVKEMNRFGDNLNNVLNIMGETNTKSWSLFEITGFHNGEKVCRTTAHGTHEGPYIGKDEMELIFNIQVSTTEADAVSTSTNWQKERVVLTQEHFVGFGDAYDTLLFAKDGVSYNLRYLDHNLASKITNELEADKSGKSVGVRRSPTSTSTSNGISLPSPTLSSANLGSDVQGEPYLVLRPDQTRSGTNG
jgi:hypothetical protein